MANGFYDKEPPSNAAEARLEYQVANAATYLAHQAFHIRKALERIADASKRNLLPDDAANEEIHCGRVPSACKDYCDGNESIKALEDALSDDPQWKSAGIAETLGQPLVEIP